MQFVDAPPPSKRASSDFWPLVVAECKANPGKAAPVGRFSGAIRSFIRRGDYKAFYPEGTPDVRKYMEDHWYVTSRSTGETTDTGGAIHEVWVSWKGECREAGCCG